MLLIVNSMSYKMKNFALGCTTFIGLCILCSDNFVANLVGAAIFFGSIALLGGFREEATPGTDAK